MYRYYSHNIAMIHVFEEVPLCLRFRLNHKSSVQGQLASAELIDRTRLRTTSYEYEYIQKKISGLFNIPISLVLL